MKVHANTFIEGLDKDTSKLKYKNTKYFHAKNLSPVTEKGLSTGSFENTKGTLSFLNFPPLNSFLVIETNYSEFTGMDRITITLEGGSTDPNYPNTKIIDNEEIIVPNSEDYLQFIIDKVLLFNSTLSPNLYIKHYKIKNSPRLVLYSPLNNFLNFNSYNNLSKARIHSDFRDFKVIGSGSARDIILYFTSNESGPKGFGQIWRASYDSENITGSQRLTLLYNGKLNFSIENPIRDIVFKFINDSSAFVYWTDFNNIPRKFDFLNANSIALREEELSWSMQAKLFPAIPLTENQDGGNLPSGLYYVTYKLEKFGGAQSIAAPFYNPVPVVADIAARKDNKGTRFELFNYPSEIIGTTKSLNYIIQSLPLGFDKIKIYVVYEDSPENYLTYLVKEEIITGKKSLNFSVPTLVNKTLIPISEIFDYNVDFKRIKTMTTLDNTLLVGNVEYAGFDIDFDARAYRFRRSSNDTYVTAKFYEKGWGISPDDDAINPHNDDDLDSKINPLRYKRNSTILGGEGERISYEFVTETITLDHAGSVRTVSDPHLPGTVPYVTTPFQSSQTRLGFNVGPGYNNFKNGRFEAHIKGYMRDEVYRFGIVFYSKTGRPSPVKWIGDIRFPSAGDDPSYTLIAKLINPKTNPGFRTDGYSMGIKFSVDVSEIKNDISGFSIVRAPRREKDRTIIAEGALYRTKLGNNVSNVDRLFNFTDLTDTDSPWMEERRRGVPRWYHGTLDAPDLKMVSGAIVEDYSYEDKPKYYLKPVAGYIQITDNDTGDLNGDSLGTLAGNIEKMKYSKSFLHMKSNTRAERLKFSRYLGRVEKVETNQQNLKVKEITSTFLYRNSGYPTALLGGDEGTFASPGEFTLLVGNRVDEVIKTMFNVCYGYTADDIVIKDPETENRVGDDVLFAGGGGKVERKGQAVLVDLCRKLPSQYGGNTVEAIRNTEYISTGSYVSVDSGSTVKDVNVFGGDIYVCAFGHKKLFRLDNDDSSYMSGIQAKFFPVQSIINYDMRVGFHVNNSYSEGETQNFIDRDKAPDEYLIPVLFHKEKSLSSYFAEGELGKIRSKFDTRIHASQSESEGENVDSWSIFKPFTYMDITNEDGQINEIDILQESIISFQDISLKRTLFNPIASLQTAEGLEAILGTSKGFLKSQYITNNIGTKHQMGILKTRDMFYFFDSNHKKIYRFSSRGVEPLSDIKGIYSFLKSEISGSVIHKDNPLIGEGITTAYDYNRNEAIFTFHTKIGLETSSLLTETTIKQVICNEYPNQKIVKEETNGDSSCRAYIAENVEPTARIYVIPINEVQISGNFHYFRTEQNETVADLKTEFDSLAGAKIQIDDSKSGQPSLWKDIIVDKLTDSWIDFHVNAPNAYQAFLTNQNSRQANFRIVYDKDLTGMKQDLAKGCTLQIEDKFAGWQNINIDHITLYGLHFKIPELLKYISQLMCPRNPLLAVPEIDNVNVRSIEVKVVSDNDTVTSDDDDKRISKAFTLCFNENLDSFTEERSFTPFLYFQDKKKFFSQVPGGYEIFVHQEGIRGYFYNQFHDSELHLIITPGGDHSKIFNNLELFTIVEDENGNDVFDETLKSLRIFNEYQDTGEIILVPNSNIRRRARIWRHTIGRDKLENFRNARIRNPYMELVLKYYNTSNFNRRIIIHDIKTFYSDAFM